MMKNWTKNVLIHKMIKQKSLKYDDRIKIILTK